MHTINWQQSINRKSYLVLWLYYFLLIECRFLYYIYQSFSIMFVFSIMFGMKWKEFLFCEGTTEMYLFI